MAGTLHQFPDNSGHHMAPFYLKKNNRQITDSGIDYIKKHAALVAQKLHLLREKTASTYILRRSKVTHMLLNGDSLMVIQRFLWHKPVASCGHVKVFFSMLGGNFLYFIFTSLSTRVRKAFMNTPGYVRKTRRHI
jgi:hypothetical protein